MNWMRRDRTFRHIFLLLLVLAPLLASCRQSAQSTPTPESASSITIELTAEPNPPTVGMAALVVIVKDAGQPIEGAQIAVHGDMTHAGMQPVDGFGTTDASGISSVPFNWTMGGDWIVTVTASLPDGTQIERTFNFGVGA